jgi:hypothetical protein
MVLLAASGIFALHASAVAVDGRLVALPGSSGTGKSTLAAAPGWQRVADDTLPLAWTAGGVQALPRYPQLKLGGLLEGLPPSWPLAAVVRLDRRPGPGGVIRVQRLAPRPATATLLRHTVAAALFDPVLLAAHLDFATTVTARLPVFELDYPSDLGRLPEVRAAVAEALDTLA